MILSERFQSVSFQLHSSTVFLSVSPCKSTEQLMRKRKKVRCLWLLDAPFSYGAVIMDGLLFERKMISNVAPWMSIVHCCSVLLSEEDFWGNSLMRRKPLYFSSLVLFEYIFCVLLYALCIYISCHTIKKKSMISFSFSFSHPCLSCSWYSNSALLEHQPKTLSDVLSWFFYLSCCGVSNKAQG